MKGYGELLKDDPAWAERAGAFAAKVRDVTETLVELGTAQAPRHRLDLRIAYHDACHLAHAQGIREAPRRLLAAIPGLELVDLPESDVCCGAAGTYNLTQPELAGTLGRRKIENVVATGAEIVVAANAGCLLQIGKEARQRSLAAWIAHPFDVLARAYGLW